MIIELFCVHEDDIRFCSSVMWDNKSSIFIDDACMRFFSSQVCTKLQAMNSFMKNDKNIKLVQTAGDWKLSAKWREIYIVQP